MFTWTTTQYHTFICRDPLEYYQTFAIVEGHTYSVLVETITDVEGDTAGTSMQVMVPIQPPGTLYIKIPML